MPIYEYRCNDCGFQKEYLQKVSDAQLTDCPECGKASFSKLLTAPGFQLKGSGWYATDFKGSVKAAASGEASEPAKSEPSKSEPAKSESAATGGGCGNGPCPACT